MLKTNPMRLLDEANIPYIAREYTSDDGKMNALSIAEKILIPAEQCYKTLVTCNEKHEYFVFVLPATGELDLKKAAKAAGQKNLNMLPQKQLFPLTGYVHGGCSPIGMKRQFPTYIHEDAFLYEFIGISGGKIGCNLAVHPEKLAEFLHAEFVDLTR